MRFDINSAAWLGCDGVAHKNTPSAATESSQYVTSHPGELSLDIRYHYVLRVSAQCNIETYPYRVTMASSENNRTDSSLAAVAGRLSSQLLAVSFS